MSRDDLLLGLALLVWLLGIFVLFLVAVQP